MSRALQKHKSSLTENPEKYGAALAHILTTEAGQDSLLGQAWLAGPNCLATCAHVVEPFLKSPSTLIVQFPASGNRYTVLEIKLHPSFGRESEQLVKFDAAVLWVDLSFPEREALPLPVQYNVPLQPQEELSAVRYPIHLGQFTSTPTPLAQIGRMLGPLRKNDSFHLLHDLALAPGDSGSPIFSGGRVVAIHCGDTATLPGLNLPVTSIRLALDIDALKELGISENYHPDSFGGAFSTKKSAAICLGLFFTLFALLSLFTIISSSGQFRMEKNDLTPIKVEFHRDEQATGSRFKFQEPLTTTITVPTDCFVQVFAVGRDDATELTSGGRDPVKVLKDVPLEIKKVANFSTLVGPGKQRLHIFAFKFPDVAVAQADLPVAKIGDKTPPSLKPLRKKFSEFQHDLEGRYKNQPTDMSHVVVDLPSADKPPSFASYSQ